MRKVVAAEFLSLDGVMESPDKWHVPYFNEERGRAGGLAWVGGCARWKVVASEFLSLDGVMESPDKWHFPYFNEEMGQAVGEGFAAADAMLLGRVNYEEWAAFWPR